MFLLSTHAPLLNLILIITATAFPFHALAASSTCYFPDGSIDADSSPCLPAQAMSPCCTSSMACLSNGLCLHTPYNHILRQSCTDKSWTSPSCPQYCTTFAPSLWADIRQCDGQNYYWVCGMNVSVCSIAGTMKLSLPAGLIKDARSTFPSSAYLQIPTSSSALATATGQASMTHVSTVTTTTVGTVTVTASAQSDKNTGNEAAIGAGVGIPLFLAFAFVLGLFLRERKLRRSNFITPVLNYAMQQQQQQQQGFVKLPETAGYTHELIPERNMAELH